MSDVACSERCRRAFLIHSEYSTEPLQRRAGKQLQNIRFVEETTASEESVVRPRLVTASKHYAEPLKPLACGLSCLWYLLLGLSWLYSFGDGIF